MSITGLKHSLNGNKLDMIGQEFSEKIKDNPGVAGLVAKPYGSYLNLIVLLEPDIARDLEDEVYDAYGEIFDKYDGQVMFEFDPMDCFSPDMIDQIAYDNASHIIYRKGTNHAH